MRLFTFSGQSQIMNKALLATLLLLPAVCSAETPRELDERLRAYCARQPKEFQAACHKEANAAVQRALLERTRARNYR
jgi:hypothetical protein